MIFHCTKLLQEDEELWSKQMPDMVRSLLDKNRDIIADRGQWLNQGKLDRKTKERAEKQHTQGKIFYISIVTFKK